MTPAIARSASVWIGRSLARRYVMLSLALLLVVQLASLLIVDASMHRHARAALPEQLAMGTRTLQSLIAWRADKLIEGARLLAADYGFREAVLSHDRETIESVLANHGARIGASEVALLGTDFATLAVSANGNWNAFAAADSVARLAAHATGPSGVSGIDVIGGMPRQVVLVPVKAPRLMGWVLMYFPLPASIASDVHRLSGTDLTVLSRKRSGDAWSVALGGPSPALALALARTAWPEEHSVGDTRMTDLAVDGRDLGISAFRLTTNARAGAAADSQPEVVALLSVFVDEAVRPPRELRLALLATTLLGFAAFGVASAYTARRVTTPLHALAAAAERLGQGDSATPIISADRVGEVGELALAFERMRISLAASREQMVQSEKLASIGQLAAGVAHEINNPIGFVFSNFGTLEDYLLRLFRMLAAYRQEEAQLTGTPQGLQLARLRDEIELDYLEEDIPALMTESRDGIRRVLKIVQDLKDFSHVDAHQQWETTHLHAGLDLTLNIVANEIRYKADVVKAYGELPTVECRPSELNQVFMNLLVNAAHAIGEKQAGAAGARQAAAEPQRGTITLSTGVAGPEVWVEVADTGSGIAPADMKRIFDPFFTTKPVGKGTGLGLSLSYGIVKTHGGRIEVASEPGRGTSFRVCVPIRRTATPVAPEPFTSARQKAPGF